MKGIGTDQGLVLTHAVPADGIGLGIVMKMLKLLAAVVLAAALLPAMAAKEKPPRDRPSPEEIGALPEYCQARFAGDEGVVKEWSRRIGVKQWLHIHHFCIGINQTNRATLTQNKRLRAYLLQSASSQFGYVLSRWPPDFVLTNEAKDRRSEVELMLQLVGKRR